MGTARSAEINDFRWLERRRQRTQRELPGSHYLSIRRIQARAGLQINFDDRTPVIAGRFDVLDIVNKGC
jgi:hypothetical protein